MAASKRVFLDTNVLLYAADRDADEKRKIARRALRGALKGELLAVSTQVLQEFFVVATKKMGVAIPDARRLIDLMCKLTVVQVTPDLIRQAIDLHAAHSLSFWDALVLRCARASGCDVCLSEDMQHETVFDGVTVVNPFVK